MKEKNNNINDVNQINQNNYVNTEKRDVFPQFSDILSISSNPEDLFTLLYPVGHGGFGTVFKAIHNSTNTIVAIKIIDFIHNINNNSNLLINQNEKISFNYYSVQQETTLMKLVNKSKYIVNYYGSYFSRKTNTLWLILEYCSSGSAIDLMLSMNRTYTELEISTIIENILEGLILIHSMNLIHRDIKGANILLSEDGYAKLGDFGVGIRLTDGREYRNSKKGSPYWMSPQVVKNNNYDMKTDIWSLGITCVELCNGEPPFSDLNPKNVMEKIAMFPPNIDDLINKNEHTEEFYDFVKKCLEVDPQKRPNAKELIKHNFIKKYSRGNNFLAQLISKHSEDLNRFRKIVNEKNKNYKINLQNKIDYNYQQNNSNQKNIVNKNDNNDNIEDDNNYNNIDILNDKNNDYQLNSYQDNKQSQNNDSILTSHFHNGGNKNDIQEKKKLLINNKFSSSFNLENNGINSTKDTQKQNKNIISIKNDSNKNIYYNSILENNQNDFTTFHKDNDKNNNNINNNEKIYQNHYEQTFLDKNNILIYENGDINKKTNNDNNNNYHEIEIDDIKIKLNYNGIMLNKPILSMEKMNLVFGDNDFGLENLYRNRNNKKKGMNNKKNNEINKSSDNLFLSSSDKKLKYGNYKNNNYIYKKPKIIKNIINLKKKSKVNSLHNEKNNNKEGCKGCSLYRLKELEKIISDSDEEGSVNKTKLFRTKSNCEIFKKDKDKNENMLVNTNYNFYKNKKQLNINNNDNDSENKNFFGKNERINKKNNYSDIYDFQIEQNKYNINKSKIKIHQKYLGK